VYGHPLSEGRHTLGKPVAGLETEALDPRGQGIPDRLVQAPDLIAAQRAGQSHRGKARPVQDLV
jgi:hypothetical protein